MKSGLIEPLALRIDFWRRLAGHSWSTRLQPALK